MISVVIPTYNNGPFIRDALDSVFFQTVNDLEVIVVDDGSTDDTEEVIAPYRARIKYIRQENRGPSAARNNGLRSASGEYIAFLDADDLWLPEKLELQMAEISKAAQPVLVGCGMQIIDIEGRLLETLFKWKTSEEFQSQIGYWNVFGNPSCALTSKSVFEDVGLFNERLRFGEDWEMWLRISQKYPVRLVPRALVKFRVQGAMKPYEDIHLQKRCINEIIRHLSGPDRSLNRRKALSRMYTELAWTSLQKGHRLKSIMFAARAVLLHPFKAYGRDEKRMLLVRTLLPAPVLNRILRIKTVFMN